MKIITERDYLKMTPEEQDKHHNSVRADLISKGLVKPQ